MHIAAANATLQLVKHAFVLTLISLMLHRLLSCYHISSNMNRQERNRVSRYVIAVVVSILICAVLPSFFHYSASAPLLLVHAQTFVTTMPPQDIKSLYVDPTTGTMVHRCGTSMCLSRANDTGVTTSGIISSIGAVIAQPFYESITGATLVSDGNVLKVNLPPQLPGQSSTWSLPLSISFAYDVVRHFKQTSLV